jgi:hypothetical protein
MNVLNMLFTIQPSLFFNVCQGWGANQGSFCFFTFISSHFTTELQLSSYEENGVL